MLMVNKMDYKNNVIQEIQTALNLVNDDDLKTIAEVVVNSNKVLVVGVGRVLISLKAWVKRWRHLGIDINYVGNETESAIHEGDVLIVGSSSGESIIPVKIAQLAKKLGITIIYVGSNLNSTVAKISDYQLRIPCKTKLGLPDEINSFQPMSTLFEQTLYLVGDIISYIIMDKKNLDEEFVKMHHANLE